MAYAGTCGSNLSNYYDLWFAHTLERRKKNEDRNDRFDEDTKNSVFFFGSVFSILSVRFVILQNRLNDVCGLVDCSAALNDLISSFC